MALCKCPECQNLISTQSKFCPKCGFDVEKYMQENGNKIQCNQCWAINPPDATHCCKCGNNLQYSNHVADGLPDAESEFEKKSIDHNILQRVIIVLLAAILLFLLMPKVFTITFY